MIKPIRIATMPKPRKKLLSREPQFANMAYNAPAIRASPIIANIPLIWYTIYRRMLFNRDMLPQKKITTQFYAGNTVPSLIGTGVDKHL